MTRQILEQLQRQFGSNKNARFCAGKGNLPMIEISNQHAEAKVYLHGAHVSHYKPRGQAPVIWMSNSSWFETGKPIRGGIPICWPWFGPHKSNATLPGHGFARLHPWTAREIATKTDGSAHLTLGLSFNSESLAIWPHRFELEYSIIVGAQLEIALHVKNVDTAPFTFEEALHTYLVVSDIRKIKIEGLSGAKFADKLRDNERVVQEGAISFTSETDRLYLDTQSRCEAIDPVLIRRITIAKSGSNSTVVWNPWIAKSKAMKDFDDNEWTGMLCIETANAGDNAVTVAPGQTHQMRAIISLSDIISSR